MTVGVWRHEVGVYTGAQLQAWINSVLEASTNSTTDPTSQSSDFRIGQEPDGTDQFDGLVDEAIIAKRYFREEEIKTIYNYCIHATVYNWFCTN